MEQPLNTNNKDNNIPDKPNIFSDVSSQKLRTKLAAAIKKTSTDTLSNLKKLTQDVLTDYANIHKQKTLSLKFKAIFCTINPYTKEVEIDPVRTSLIVGILFVFCLIFIKLLSSSSNLNNESLTVNAASPPSSQLSPDTVNNSPDPNSFVDKLIENHNKPTTDKPFDLKSYYKNKPDDDNTYYSDDNSSDNASYQHQGPSKKELEEQDKRLTIKIAELQARKKNKEPIIITNNDNSNDEDYPEPVFQYATDYNPDQDSSNNEPPAPPVPDYVNFKPTPGTKLLVKLEFDLITNLNQPAIAIPCDPSIKFPDNTRFYGQVSGNYNDNVALIFTTYTINSTKFDIKALAAQDSSASISAEKIGEVDLLDSSKSGAASALKTILPNSDSLINSFISNAGSSVLSNIRSKNTSYNVYKIENGSTFYVVFLP